MRGLDHFSLLAPFYDRVFAEFDPTLLRELLALPADRLLDAGGGTGRVSALLAGQARLVVVTDASRGMLAEARAKAGVRAARGYAERLPYADGTFDRALVVDALHHFRDHELAAAELWRVLKPGGRLVIEEMNRERWPVKLIALGERLLLMGSHFHGPDTLQRLFEGCGGRVTVRANHAINVWVIVEKPG